MGGVVPIPLRFVLARLHWARSVRRPGALARARLFPAVPVGAGGWAGGAGCAPAPLSGGGSGDEPPCLGVRGPGPPRLARRWGGWGGGRAAASLIHLSGAARGSLPCPPSRRKRARSVGGGPFPGGPFRPEPLLFPPRVGNFHGGGHGGRSLHTVLVCRRAPPQGLVCVPLRRAGVGSPVGRDPCGSRRGGALGHAVCSRMPPPASRSLPGEGGASPLLRGGRGSLLWPSSLVGEREGGAPHRPPPPCPVGRRPAICCLRRAP